MLTTTNPHILRGLAAATVLLPALGLPGGSSATGPTPPTPPVLSAATTCVHGGDPGFRAVLPSNGPAAIAVDPSFSVPGIGHPDPGFAVRLPVCK